MFLMNKIILDFEYCEVLETFIKERRICKKELIQIGAVMLDEYNEEIDCFNEYIKPKYSRVSEYIEDLTHISNEMLEDKRSFEEVMDDFLAWCGEEYVIYSWSKCDIGVLRKEIALRKYHHINLKYMLRNWLDLQADVDRTLKSRTCLALDYVLDGLGIEFEGTPHSAIDDARNTAYVYQAYQNKRKFKRLMFRKMEAE
jgi:inhibitor of KinA sporulation pathway (predicted exonuclease)